MAEFNDLFLAFFLSLIPSWKPPDRRLPEQNQENNDDEDDHPHND